MTRIGSINSIGTDQLKAIRRIQELGRAISQNQERLATLKRINSAKDDPAGLIQASLLEMDISAAESASKSISRANSILSTADQASEEILTQLQNIRTQIFAAAGDTAGASEKAAAQLEIDTSIRAINSLAQTQFAGKQLLTGASGFNATGFNTSTTLDVDVLHKASADDVTVNINVTSTATQASNSYTGGALVDDVTLIVAGPDGSTTVSLASGSTTQDITDAINDVTYLTGVTATRIDANQVDFKSVDYGSRAEMTITTTEGTFSTTTAGTTTGTDAVATINGQSVTGDGSTFNYNSDSLSLIVKLSPTASGAITPFTVTGEGLNVVIGSSPGALARVGIPNMLASSLGGVTGRLTDIQSGGDFTVTAGKIAEALQIVDDAIDDVTRGRAVIGSFQKYTLDSSSRVIESSIENMTSALSAIRDTDVATESALLTNNQLLQQTAFQALAISSLRHQDVLSLLKSLTS